MYLQANWCSLEWPWTDMFWFLSTVCMCVCVSVCMWLFNIQAASIMHQSYLQVQPQKVSKYNDKKMKRPLQAFESSRALLHPYILRVHHLYSAHRLKVNYILSFQPSRALTWQQSLYDNIQSFDGTTQVGLLHTAQRECQEGYLMA